MALARYVKVDRGIWDKPFMRRDPVARLLYLYLLDYPVDTLIGCVHWDWDRFAFHMPELKRERAAKAIDVLAENGLIISDGEYIRILDYPDYQGHGGPKLDSAMKRELERVSGKTRLFDTVSSAPDTVSSAENTVSHITLHNTTEHNITEGTGAVAPPAKSRREPVSLPDPSPLSLQIADRLETWIAQLVNKAGYTPPKGQRRTPVQIARAIDASGCDPDGLFAALRWAINERYWRGELLNQASWCIDRRGRPSDRWAVLVCQYKSREQNAGLSAFGDDDNSTFVIPPGGLTDIEIDPDAKNKLLRRAEELTSRKQEDSDV